MHWLSGLSQLWKSPRFSVPVFVTLTLGFAATAVVLGVLQTVLWQPLPFQQADQLIRIYEHNPESGNRIAMAQQNARDLEAADTGLVSMAVYSCFPDTIEKLTDGAANATRFRADSCVVGSEFFRTLAVQPQIGRDFGNAAELSQDPRVALISEALWRERFNGAPDALGQRLRISGETVTIIGVIAAKDSFPQQTQAWISDRMGAFNTARSGHNFAALGRLKPGVSLEQAQAKLNQLAKAWKAIYGKSMTTDRFPVLPLIESMVGNYRTILWVTLAAALFLLLVACLNVGNLWVIRMLEQRSQIATKLSLGASTSSLIQGLFAQSLLLAAGALLIALLIAKLVMSYAKAWLIEQLPRIADLAINPRLLLMMLGLAAVVAMLCVAFPVLAVRRTAMVGALGNTQRNQTDSKAMNHWRQLLSAAQTTLTIVLLTGMGLMWQTLHKLTQIDPGFRIDGIAAADVSLDMDTLADAAQKAPRYQLALDRLVEQVGVTHAALTSGLPLTQSGSNGTFLIETPNTPAIASEDYEALGKRYNETSKDMQGYAEFRVVSRSYFDTLDIGLREGRGFLDTDTINQSHVALISESVAKTTFAGKPAIGQRIQFGGMDGDVRNLTIVGIVADVRGSGLDKAPEAAVYVHVLQRPRHAGSASIVVRGAVDDATLRGYLRNVLEVRGGFPVAYSSLREIYDQSMGLRSLLLRLFGLFALVAFLLALLGLYTLTRYNLAQKKHEYFVRHALGANLQRLLSHTLSRALLVQVMAIGLGLLASIALSKTLSSVLFEIGMIDLQTWLVVAIGFAIAVTVTILASSIGEMRALQSRRLGA